MTIASQGLLTEWHYFFISSPSQLHYYSDMLTNLELNEYWFSLISLVAKGIRSACRLWWWVCGLKCGWVWCSAAAAAAAAAAPGRAGWPPTPPQGGVPAKHFRAAPAAPAVEDNWWLLTRPRPLTSDDGLEVMTSEVKPLLLRFNRPPARRIKQWMSFSVITSWNFVDPLGRPSVTACSDHYFHTCLSIRPSSLFKISP